MERPNGAGERPWWIVGAALAGLLMLIAAVGVAGIVVNEQVRDVTRHALLFDVELEDEGDDLRVAVLDLRHYHRNITFNGPDEGTLADHDRAYAGFVEEVGELEQLDISDLEVVQPDELRALASRYREDFRANIGLFGGDPEAFMRASDEGLRRLGELELAAEQIDEEGERQTETSLAKVERETELAFLILLTLLGGLALVGAALAVTAARVLTRLRASYAREQSVSRELTRALQSKNDFIADASHELRTPLTVIRGNADIGLAAPGASIHPDVLTDISAEATRMSRLVDDLLFLARSDAGAPPLEREYVPAQWLVARLAKPAEVLALHHGSCLSATIGGDGHLEVDPARVEQAVLVLIDNAAKHSPPGSCVSLSSRSVAGALAIEVADHGPGIPEAELPLIFDRFYQVGKRRTRKKGGSGLGLSIARSIVQAHGGSIAVESTLGRGTTMTLRLPLVTAPERGPKGEVGDYATLRAPVAG